MTVELTSVTAEKPRLCPHGNVWLVGNQQCACKTCGYTYREFDPGDGDLVRWYVVACSGKNAHRRENYCPNCGKPTELIMNVPSADTRQS